MMLHSNYDLYSVQADNALIRPCGKTSYMHNNRNFGSMSGTMLLTKEGIRPAILLGVGELKEITSGQIPSWGQVGIGGQYS